VRICLYNVTATLHFGGLETYCWELGRTLVDLDHQVVLMAGEGGEARNDAVQLCCFPFKARHSYASLGSRYKKLRERLSFARQAGQWLLQQEFDATIIVKPFDIPVLWWARRRGSSAITLLCSGGVDFFWGDRHFAHSLDYIVATSAYNAKQLEKRYSRRVEHIPYGVDIETFNVNHSKELRVVMGIDADKILLLSAGRLVGWKGLHIVLEAISDLPDVHFLIVGEGEARQALEKQATELGIAERVYFTGRIDHDDLPDYLSEADIFVQPSIGEEAFGISVIEAMACQLPVVVSNNGGMVDFVSDGVEGSVLPPGDVLAWREGLTTLTTNQQLRAQMGAAGRAKVEAHYTWRANAQSLIELIETTKR